ncbi:MAG: OmpA family protein [bacterium]
MRSIWSSSGWALFLLLAAGFLLFYNFAHVPRAETVTRQQNEIAMWLGQVEALTDSLRGLQAGADTALNVSFTWPELFAAGDDPQVSKEGEAALRTYLPTLQSSLGPILVIGHTDSGNRGRFTGTWEHGAARAAAVGRALLALGIQPNRVTVISSGETQPAGDNNTPDGRAGNRRVVLVLLKR